MEEHNLLVGERMRKLAELEAAGIDPYPTGFKVRHLAADLHREYAGLSEDGGAGPPVSIAGRLMSLRHHGKVTFAHLQDCSGKMQIYLVQDKLGAEAYDFCKKLDVGDHLGWRASFSGRAQGNSRCEPGRFSSCQSRCGRSRRSGMG